MLRGSLLETESESNQLVSMIQAPPVFDTTPCYVAFSDRNTFLAPLRNRPKSIGAGGLSE